MTGSQIACHPRVFFLWVFVLCSGAVLEQAVVGQALVTSSLSSSWCLLRDCICLKQCPQCDSMLGLFVRDVRRASCRHSDAADVQALRCLRFFSFYFSCFFFSLAQKKSQKKKRKKKRKVFFFKKKKNIQKI